MAGTESLRSVRETICSIAARHGAVNVRVFGSFARGEARESSDLDLLVDMEPTRNLLDTIGLIQDLQDLLGRHVDVVTERSLNQTIRTRVLAEATPL